MKGKAPEGTAVRYASIALSRAMIPRPPRNNIKGGNYGSGSGNKAD